MMEKQFDGDSELEDILGKVLGSYWHSHMPKSNSIFRHVDWSNPKSVEMAMSQIEGAIHGSIAHLTLLQKILDHLWWKKRNLADDRVIFFDDLFGVEWSELFSDEEWEAIGDCRPNNREVVNFIGDRMKDLVKIAINKTLEKCMEE